MARKAVEAKRARTSTAKKVVLVCERCGREFMAEQKTRLPKYCEQCTNRPGTWELVGMEESKFGKVKVERNTRSGKIRKILVE